MKKIILLLCFLSSMHTAFAQSPGIDTTLQKIAAEKDADKRLHLIMGLYGANEPEIGPERNIQIFQAVLAQAQKSNDKIAEAIALATMGACYRLMGNTVKGLDVCLKAMAIAEKTGNLLLICRVKQILGLIYKDRGDDAMALSLFLSSQEDALKAGAEIVQANNLMNLGGIYFRANKLDSALMYSQRAYEQATRIEHLENLSFIFGNLGAIHGKMGNHTLAQSYRSLAVENAVKTQKPRDLLFAYQKFSEYYRDINKIDSSILYAKKSIAAVQNTPYSTGSDWPAKALADMYKNINADSALKYYEIYTAANDSLFNVKAVQQVQLLSFEEEQRKQESDIQKIKAAEERKHNIQYALIAIGIITLISLFLLLSRSFITNSKMIEFFGVIALLLVFEFLNLLLHPFLESVTNHSPLLMLMALVCIAALLVPLHHKFEKWSTAKLVEKNKQVRLAAAKKTIEQLEGKADNL